MTFRPDPVSVLMEESAQALLDRAYIAEHSRSPDRVRVEGGWVSYRLPAPAPDEVRYIMRYHQIDVTGPDHSLAVGGRGLNARSRWGRAFVRALYRLNKKSKAGPLEVTVSRRYRAVGIIPAGWDVRIRHPSRSGAIAAVQRKPDSARIYDDDGETAKRWADYEKRDWD